MSDTENTKASAFQRLKRCVIVVSYVMAPAVEDLPSARHESDATVQLCPFAHWHYIQILTGR